MDEILMSMDWINQVVNTDALSLLKSMPDESVNCVITDPPYGVGKVSAWREAEDRFSEIMGNDEIDGTWIPETYRCLTTVGAMYVFAKWQNVDEWKLLIRTAGFKVRNMIVWDKMRTGAGDPETCYAPEYELILFCVKGRHVLRGSRPSDIIHHPKIQPDLLRHPYEKPVGLLERLVLTSTDKGDLVLDCFAGSGSTLQAARKNGRQYIGSEIESSYLAIARADLQLDYTTPMFESLNQERG